MYVVPLCLCGDHPGNAGQSPHVEIFNFIAAAKSLLPRKFPSHFRYDLWGPYMSVTTRPVSLRLYSSVTDPVRTIVACPDRPGLLLCFSF